MQSVDIKRDNSQAATHRISKDMDTRNFWQFSKCDFQQFLLTFKYVCSPHFIFQFDTQGGADSLQKTWCAAVFAGFNVVEVFVFSPWVCPVHSAATGLVGSVVRV